MFDCWTHQFYSLSFLPKWSRKIATLCMGLLCKALWFKFILRFSLQTHLTFFNKRPNVLSLKLHKWDASTPIVSCLSGVMCMWVVDSTEHPSIELCRQEAQTHMKRCMRVYVPKTLKMVRCVHSSYLPNMNTHTYTHTAASHVGQLIMCSISTRFICS